MKAENLSHSGCINFGRTLALFALLALSAFAQARPLYFLLDMGTEIGQADRGDLIMDLKESCNSKKIAVNLPGYLQADELPQIEFPSPAETRTKVQEFNLSVVNEKVFEYVHVFDFFQGTSNATFVLLPEMHFAMNGSQESFAVLHMTRTMFAAELIKSQPKALVFNFREGIAGTKIDLRYNFKEKDILRRILELAEQGYATTFTALANVFKDQKRVKSAYLEKGDMLYADLLLNVAGYEGKKSFDDVKRTLKKNNVFFIEKDLETSYNRLKLMTENELNTLAHLVCVYRGYQMAESAVSQAKRNGANLVFLAYGASHHAEIADYLRKTNSSFIAILGKRPQ